MMRRTSLGSGGGSVRDVGGSSGLGGGDGSGGDVGCSSGLGGEIFVRYPPSLSRPPLHPQSHNLSDGRRQQLDSLIEQNTYLQNLLVERNIMTPLSYDFPHTQRLLNEEISRFTTLLEDNKTQNSYLQDLLVERNIVTPLSYDFPHTQRLLNEEISRLTTPLEDNITQNSFEHPSLLASGGIFQNAGANINQSRFEQPSPLASGGIVQNAGADMTTLASLLSSERPVSSSQAPNWLNAPGSSLSPAPNWLNAPGSSSSPAPNWLNAPASSSFPAPNWLNNAQGSSSGVIVTRSLKLYLPADKYPNHQSVAQIGDSLEQLEAKTNCRITLRGRSSMKDILEEKIMRGIPGYEHLQEEPLHILIEAELPIELVDAHLLQAREILQRLLFTSMPRHGTNNKKALEILSQATLGFKKKKQ